MVFLTVDYFPCWLGRLRPPTPILPLPCQTHLSQCWHLCSRIIGNHLMCVTSASGTHPLPPTTAVFITTACASTATFCAIMDYPETGDAGSGCEDENCSALVSSVSHSDQFCTKQEPLFGLIELGGFAKYNVLFVFCISIFLIFCFVVFCLFFLQTKYTLALCFPTDLIERKYILLTCKK